MDVTWKKYGMSHTSGTIGPRMEHYELCDGVKHYYVATPERGEVSGKTEVRSVGPCRTGLNCKYGKDVKPAELPEAVADEIIFKLYTDEDINRLIRAAGGDPEAIDRESRKQARELWKRWKGE